MKQIYKQTFIIVTSCFFILTPMLSHAVFMQAGEVVEVSSEQDIVDDVYVAGESVSVTGRVNGDVLIAGKMVSVTNIVEGDVLGLGQEVKISGNVQDDVRLAGERITLSSQIGSDALIAGKYVHLESGATISGVALIAAETIVIDGTIEGDAKLRARNITINGTVQGKVSAQLDNRLEVGENASLQNGLWYKAPSEGIIAESAAIQGDVVHEKKVTHDSAPLIFGGLLAAFNALFFFGVLLGCILLVWLFPSFATRVVQRVTDEPGHTLLLGLGTFILIPLAVLLLFISILGSILGVFLGLSFVVVFALAKFLSGILAGALLAHLFVKEMRVNLAWTVLGIFSLSFIQWVPFIGPLVSFLLLLAALGALVSILHTSWWKSRKDTVIDVVRVEDIPKENQ